MVNNFLKEQINILQNDYNEILKNALNKFSTDDFPMIIDEINLFWFANRDIVLLILQNISFDYDCFIFTGATFLDIDDHEHYPFISLGKTHIVDDPLYKYSNFSNNLPNNDFSTQIKEQMLLTIKDNIKIIESYSDYIYILPVTLLTDVKSNLVKDATEQAFFSMFKDGTNNREQYFKKFKTIEDIENALKDGISETLIFSEEDDGESLCSRFKNQRMYSLPFSQDSSDSMIFFFLVNGFFAQSFSILLKCAEYKMIPYLRFEVTYRYTILLGGNFTDNAEMKLILLKSICSHLFYRIFDKSKVEDIDFNQYLSTIIKENFSENVFRVLNENDIDYRNLSFSKIVNVLSEELSKVIQACKNK